MEGKYITLLTKKLQVTTIRSFKNSVGSTRASRSEQNLQRSIIENYICNKIIQMCMIHPFKWIIFHVFDYHSFQQPTAFSI